MTEKIEHKGTSAGLTLNYSVHFMEWTLWEESQRRCVRRASDTFFNILGRIGVGDTTTPGYLHHLFNCNLHHPYSPYNFIYFSLTRTGNILGQVSGYIILVAFEEDTDKVAVEEIVDNAFHLSF